MKERFILIGRAAPARNHVIWAAILSAAAAAPLLLGHGVPALQQDWQWPAHPSQCSTLTFTGSEPWNPNGAGFPQSYPEAWWPYLLMGGLCSSIGPQLSAGVYVFLSLFAAGLALGFLAARLRWSPIARFVSITAYVGSPVIFNEVQAGHTLFLFSYAVLPLLAAASLDKSRFRPVFCGLLLGLVAAQQQFLIFGEIVLALFVLRRPYARALIDFTIANGIGAIVCSTMWILAVQPGSLQGLSALRPFIHWEYVQSAAPADALRLLGYTGHYDARHFGGALHFALWSLPLLALIGLLNRNRRDSLSFLLCALLGVIFSMGLNGPLTQPLTSLFLHVPAAAVIRELYGFAALASFGYAGLIGMALSGERPKWRIVIAGSLSSIVVVCSATIAVITCNGIPQYSLGVEEYNGVGTIARSYDASRFLVLPPTPPYSIMGKKGIGSLPFAVQIGTHPSAATTLATLPSTFVAKTIDNDPQSAELLGISSIMRVPNVRSAFVESLEPGLRAMAHVTDRTYATFNLISYAHSPLVSVEPFSVEPGSLESSYPGARNIDALVGGKPVDLIDRTDIDPRRSWARTALWLSLPAWTYAEPIGIFTFASSRNLEIPQSKIVAGDNNGRLYSPKCTTVRRLSTHFALYDCQSNPTFYGSEPIVVSTALVGARTAPTQALSGTPGRVQIIDAKPYRIDAWIDATAGSAIVLRQSFDLGWHISLANASHVRVNGFANAWVVNSPVHERVSMEYEPAKIFYGCETLSFLLVLLGLSAWIFISFLQRPRAS